MARYDWPGPPPRTTEDKLALRNEHFQRFWCHIADGYLESAGEDFRDLLATLAEGGITEAAIDRQRWLPIGPSAILRGQATGRPRVAGRVRDIKRSVDGTRIYAASANGGVWFSGDAGRSWAPLGGMATTPDRNARGRSANSLVVGCLHVDFGANADADTIYAGTGEPTDRLAFGGIPGRKNSGIGILKLARPVSAVLADPTGNPWEREAPNLTGAGIYRIARSPTQADTLVAATTFGLFSRSGAFVRNADWGRVMAPPFNFGTTDRIFATDVAWVPAATAPNAAPARLFVALVNLGTTSVDTAVYVSEGGVADPFEKIILPDDPADAHNGGRLSLAAAMPLSASPTTHPQIVYVLGSAGPDEPRLWRIDGKTAVRAIKNLPPPLFGGTRVVDTKKEQSNDQSWYDMAVAVNASSPATVFLGGSAELSPGGWNASLYRCVVGSTSAGHLHLNFLPENKTTPSSDPTFIGDGVHADVHAIHVSEDGANVWIGCDGGVFMSSSNGAPASFSSRNAGLAVTECGYVASHPSHPGPVAAGTQDNGVVRRVGDTVWEFVPWGGDGGGVHYHPQPGREAFLVGQYTGTAWHGNGHFDSPVARFDPDGKIYEAKEPRAMFYSGPAAVPGASPGKARLAIGSYRLWLTDEWDPFSPPSPLMSWRTLPSGRDPIGASTLDREQDEIDEAAGNVISVKWLDPGTLNGTTFQDSKLLVLYERAIARVHQVPGVDHWDREILAWSKKKRITENSDIPAGGAPSEKLPMLGAWSEIAVHRATRAGDPTFKGSFYVSTSGASVLTNSGITEYDRMDTLWWFDGKDKFYPTGLRNNGTKAPAFSVLCDPENTDIVYAGTAMGVWKGTITQVGVGTPTWVWEMFSIGLPEAFVQDLSIYWNAGAPNGGVKLLRAAIQSRGVWEVDISANPASVGKSFLRVHALDTRRILPTSLTYLASDTNISPDPYPRCLGPDIVVVNSLPPGWAGGTPTEADIASETPDINMIGLPGSRFKAQRVQIAASPAFVLVHHRHTNPVPAAEIKVALLRRLLTVAEADGGDIPLSGTWKTAIVNLLVGGVSVTLDDQWERADAAVGPIPALNPVTVANTVRNPSGPVEARMPRAAAFTLNLAGGTRSERYLLLAVMTSSKDPLTAAELSGTTVGDVVLNCRHVCARVVHL